MHPDPGRDEDGDGSGSKEVDKEQNEATDGAGMGRRHHLVHALANRAKTVLIISVTCNGEEGIRGKTFLPV